MIILFIFSFLAGICTMLSPCILPILPIVLASGTSQKRGKPLGVVIGLVISFTFFTVTLTSLVHAFGVSADWLRYIAIGFVFLFGLFMVVPTFSLGFYRFLGPVANIGERIQAKGPKEGFFGGLMLGCALGLLWTPCAGPILAAITAFIATQSVTWMAFGLTLTYVTGAAIPLFFLAWGGGKIVRTSNLLKAHAEEVRRFFGWVTIGVAVALSLHWDIFLEQKISNYVPAIIVEDNALVHGELSHLQKEVEKNIKRPLTAADAAVRHSSYGKAPELIGLTNWINSSPLSLNQLRGRVVLVDFWTYTCINCLRTLPHIKDLYDQYKDQGLVVIGVHTPEFEFEKNPNNVIEAVSRLGITYPVAQDNRYTVWQAFNNQFWPAHYLIDQNGDIVLTQFGEGGYIELERYVRELLGLPPSVLKESTHRARPISPETYLGTERGNSYTVENNIVPHQTILYTYSKALENDIVGLKGYWSVQEQCITATGDDSYLDYNFLGKQVYLVLSGSSEVPLEVFLDGQSVKKMYVDGDRKYDIINTKYGSHLLSLKVPKGISAYAFTFGDD